MVSWVLAYAPAPQTAYIRYVQFLRINYTPIKLLKNQVKIITPTLRKKGGEKEWQNKTEETRALVHMHHHINLARSL